MGPLLSFSGGIQPPRRRNRGSSRVQVPAVYPKRRRFVRKGKTQNFRRARLILDGVFVSVSRPFLGRIQKFKDLVGEHEKAIRMNPVTSQPTRQKTCSPTNFDGGYVTWLFAWERRYLLLFLF